MWLAQVQAAVDTAAHCRAVAGAAAALKDHATAGKYLDQAQLILTTGQSTIASGTIDRESLFAEWSAKTGIDYKDPEALKKMYEAIANMHRQKAEKTARVVKSKRAAMTRAARGQASPGTMNRPKRKP